MTGHGKVIRLTKIPPGRSSKIKKYFLLILEKLKYSKILYQRFRWKYLRRDGISDSVTARIHETFIAGGLTLKAKSNADSYSPGMTPPEASSIKLLPHLLLQLLHVAIILHSLCHDHRISCLKLRFHVITVTAVTRMIVSAQGHE